jgi:hypothetical protein
VWISVADGLRTRAQARPTLAATLRAQSTLDNQQRIAHERFGERVGVGVGVGDFGRPDVMGRS